MRKKLKNSNKIIIIGFGVILIFGIVFGLHEVLLTQTEQKVSHAKTVLKSEQTKVFSMTKDLAAYENSKPSNIGEKFPNARFQKSEHVLVPIEANFKGNTAKLGQWVATYINELRQLNHINTKVSWQGNSPEQNFAHAIGTNQKVTFNGKYEVAGYQNAPDNESGAGAGQAESDQEMAYNIVMSLYDQSFQSSFVPNTVGNYSARAFLLYTGKNIGVDASSGAVVAFDYQESPEYETMVKAKVAPKTVPLSNITFDYVDMNLLKQAEAKIKSQQTNVSNDTKKLQNAEHQMNQVKKYFF